MCGATTYSVSEQHRRFTVAGILSFLITVMAVKNLHAILKTLLLLITCGGHLQFFFVFFYIIISDAVIANRG